MPRKKGKPNMQATSPATPPVPVQPSEKTKEQVLRDEFQILLTNLLARAKELGIIMRHGPVPDEKVNGGLPHGNKNGAANIEFDGIHFTGKMDDKKIGVIFLPLKLFSTGDSVTAPDGPVKIIAYNGRSPASGLPEYTGQQDGGGARLYRQDQLKK